MTTYGKGFSEAQREDAPPLQDCVGILGPTGNSQFDLDKAADNCGMAQGPRGESESRVLPGKVIFMLTDVSKLLKVVVDVNGKQVTGIIDTGASRSLISQAILDHNDIYVNRLSTDIKLIGSHTVQINSSCSPVITLHGLDMLPLEVLVVPNEVSSHQLILGIDFLKSNRLEVFVRDRKLVKHLDNGGYIVLHFENSGQPHEKICHNLVCYVSENINIPVGSVKSVPVYFTEPHVNDEHMLLFDDAGADPKLIDNVRGLSGVFDMNNKTVLVCGTDSDVSIRKGQTIGSLTTMCQLPEEDHESVPVLSDEDVVKSVELPELSDREREVVLDMLKSCKSVLSTGDNDVGLAAVTEHKIKLYDNTPIYQRPRRCANPVADEIDRQCDELNVLDIIEPSQSPWSSPIVPVRKKDGSIRLCIDYRKLNKVTIPDKHPMPNLLDSVFGLCGTKYFTSLDLVKGYYQIPLSKESREYTAFSTQRNHWQFKRLSFGLRNAPAAFQREIQAVLSAFPSNKVIAYIDDILIMGNTFAEHLTLVQKVLRTLQSYNIKVKPSKCEWFKSSVEFLGHVVSVTGIKKTGKYTEAVSNYPKPTTVGELRAFLGLVNFQRKFLPRCSEIQKPLSCLTAGKRGKILKWTEEMTGAFEKL
jgi:hypothetical protein